MKSMKFVAGLILATSIITSCGINSNQITANDTVTEKTKTLSSNISGKVIWPESFKLKATLNDVAQYGTVSILYPHNHATMANRTVATGLTDSSGNFTINTSSSWKPQNNDIFVLEVVKRNGGSGTGLISLRTFIKWTAGGWQSMTSPGVFINTKTTALAIMADKQMIPPEKTISTIDTSGGSSVPSDIYKVNINAPLKIVYRADSTNQIHVMNGDGSGSPVQVSSNSVSNNFAARLNLDASKVVWEGIVSGQVQTFSANTDGTGYTQLTSGFFNGGDPEISPDGTKVVFQADANDGNGNHIYVVNIDGSGSPVKITDGSSTTNNIDGSFSPDGTKVVYRAHDGTTEHVYVANADGSGNFCKISGTTTINLDPSFSPDGSRIAYRGLDGGKAHIYLSNADGTGNHVKLSTGIIPDSFLPKFNSTGTRVVWLGAGGPNGYIYTANTDGTGLVNLKDGFYSVNDPSISPDGTKVVFSATPYSDRDIYVKNIDGSGNLIKISSGTTNNYGPMFSTDGTRIVYLIFFNQFVM